MIMENKEIQNVLSEMAEVAGYLWHRGWAERNAGNISVNITGLIAKHEITKPKPIRYPQTFESFNRLHNEVFLMTGTGTRMRDLAKNPAGNTCIVTFDEKSGVSFSACRDNNENNLKPTSELYTHLAIHKMLLEKKKTHKIVLHTHVTEFIRLTQIKKFKQTRTINRLLWGMHPEVVMFCPKGAGFIPFILPGTKKIAERTVKELEKHDIIIWEKHGCIAIGSTLNETFDNIDLLAKSAGIFFACRNAGFVPESLSDMQINRIRRAGHGL